MIQIKYRNTYMGKKKHTLKPNYPWEWEEEIINT